MSTVDHRNVDHPQKTAQIWSPLYRNMFPPRFKGMYDHDSRFVKCTAHGTSAQIYPEASDYAYYSTARQLRSPLKTTVCFRRSWTVASWLPDSFCRSPTTIQAKESEYAIKQRHGLVQISPADCDAPAAMGQAVLCGDRPGDLAGAAVGQHWHRQRSATEHWNGSFHGGGRQQAQPEKSCMLRDFSPCIHALSLIFERQCDLSACA